MTIVCDVLVIGGGGAALRAAIAAHELDPQLDVLLVTKGILGQGGVTATACSDRMAFHATLDTTDPGGPDAWRYHADDIYRIGGQVSDADLAVVLARNAGEAFAYLDRLGVPWARRPDGTVDQFVTDGSAYARACYTGPYTANHIEQALLRRLAELPIRVLDKTMVAELLQDPSRGQVVGAALVSQSTGQVEVVAAKAVILATGGAGQVFAVNVFPEDCTGDGYALAYRAGAELVNLEFIQIGLSSLATKLACSGSMMRALPRLVNDQEEEFLFCYMPPGTAPATMYGILFAKGSSWPVSYREPSHIIDIAVDAERARGRRVFLDYSRNPLMLFEPGADLGTLAEQVRRFYTQTEKIDLNDPAQSGTPLARLLAINWPSVEWLAERGIDLRRGDRVEIAPAIQHFQGGVKIRTQAETTVPGLYAAGEVAGGQHGANRPGGNALLDGQVFGRIAGESAARYAKRATIGGVPDQEQAERAVRALLVSDGLPAAEVRRAVQEAMTRACGVYRTEEGLRRLNEKLGELESCGVRPDEDLAAALEAVNILTVARLVARAAYVRDESRGPHLRFHQGSRVPIPRDDERWNRYVVLWRGREGPQWSIREPVRPMPPDVAAPSCIL
ncbi:MAG: FAD-binding protein [Chloroflexi bacterium]|nr:FAD-binding protein [Chloroflexota bacterium]